eukprot:GHVS01051409.1.p1 GENE.GHVS01051409.1~~GHVS01051409.1.p1  ORF type:complete len:118 (-),score=5.20 GHVS01051409.1:115-468(-)
MIATLRSKVTETVYVHATNGENHPDTQGGAYTASPHIYGMHTSETDRNFRMFTNNHLLKNPLPSIAVCLSSQLHTLQQFPPFVGSFRPLCRPCPHLFIARSLSSTSAIGEAGSSTLT